MDKMHTKLCYIQSPQLQKWSYCIYRDCFYFTAKSQQIPFKRHYISVNKVCRLQEMDSAVKQFAERPEHAESDSTFVVIMSHGMRDAILGVHWDKCDPNPDVFRTDNIYSYLNTKGCPALRNKPKVILIQACRGGSVAN